jgi:hypothetical protein
MRARMEEARKKAAAEQAKRNKEQPSQVKITPKVTITPGTGSKKILDYNAKETKMRVDMEMTSDDPKAKGQAANMWVDSDAYIAPVKGYDEVKHFYQRMAKELDWLPGTMMGGNAQIAPAMVEYRKSATALNGMPLFSLVSVGMAGPPGAPQQASHDDQKSSGNPITGGIGGLFGRKKKKDDAAQDDKSDSKPSGAAGSLMDTTSEVTSVSTSAVDANLFKIPDGYKQVEAKNVQ